MNKENPNYFVRVLTIFLCVFVAGICAVNFFNGNVITSGLLVMVCILVVLVLSESFDNFSISTIITLNRDIKNKDAENSQLRTENIELRNQIVTIATNINQKQINSFNIGTSGDVEVKAAPPEEKEAEDEERSNSVRAKVSDRSPKARVGIDLREKYETASINKLLKDNDLSMVVLQRNIKITNNSLSTDPISTFEPIYDGYIQLKEVEIFIEVMMISNSSFMWRDKLYSMLSQIKFYKDIKNINAYLYLVIINNNSSQNGNDNKLKERYERYFEPAITSGLLRIVEYDKDSLVKD